jgi:hypothetical protein
MVTVGKGWTWLLDLPPSLPLYFVLSLFLTFRMFYSLPLYLILSILLHFVIPGGGDGDRRQGLGASGAWAWRSCSPSCAPFSISSCT